MFTEIPLYGVPERVGVPITAGRMISAYLKIINPLPPAPPTEAGE
jgi:hypothetical protein